MARYTTSARPGVAAWWLHAPDCSIQSVPETHIGLVCARPEIFNRTETELRAIFRRHGEVWASENRARKEILSGLLAEGWIRLRFYPRDFGWTAEYSVQRDWREVRDALWVWAVRITAGRVAGLAPLDRIDPGAHSFFLQAIETHPRDGRIPSLRAIIGKTHPAFRSLRDDYPDGHDLRRRGPEALRKKE